MAYLNDMANQDDFTMAFPKFQHLLNKGTTIFLQLLSLIYIYILRWFVKTQADGYRPICVK